MRFEYTDGERAFIDLCGDTTDVIEPTTGEIGQAQVFCAVIGANGHMYAEAVRSQDLESWLSADVPML
jgi:transposase